MRSGIALLVLALAGCTPFAASTAAKTSAGATVALGTPAAGTTTAIATPTHAAVATSSAAPRTSVAARTSVAPVPGRLPVAAVPVVVLDPGHNGGNASHPSIINAPVPDGAGGTKPCNTTGTATDAGYPEHAFTFDVVARAAALLRARGATVVLTRTDDTGFGPCVDQRAAVANAAHADAAVSVHADGGPPQGRGFHVIAPALAPDRGNAAVLDSGLALARALRASFAADTGEPPSDYTAQDGLVRRSDLAGLDLARVPAAFVECANMRNARDAALLTDPAWRARAAAGVADAVERFLVRP